MDAISWGKLPDAEPDGIRKSAQFDHMKNETNRVHLDTNLTSSFSPEVTHSKK